MIRRTRGAHALTTVSLLLGLSTIALVGCGDAPPPATAAAALEPAAPYPYSVFQIRAGCPLGRSIEYRIEKAGAPVAVEKWTFRPIDGESVSVTTEHYDAQGGATGAPTTESAKWTELHEHARFPQAKTVIANEPISTPAGTFDAMHYTVTDGDEVKSVWFARNLPGPPVKMEISKGGKTVMTLTMQANRMKAAPGAAP